MKKNLTSSSSYTSYIRDVNTRFVYLLQSIGTEEGATVITKSLIFYVAITLEAFVFCYAGEYLSAKVSAWQRNGSVVWFSFFFFFKFRVNFRKEEHN